MQAIFSVVIPVYNKANYIVQTIESVLNQSFQAFEILVINDGSTDTSLDMVKTINDSRIQIFTTKNQGVSAARNYGISKAQAAYLAFLDADDIWLPNHLENLSFLLESYPECGLYATAYTKQIGNKQYASLYNKIPKTVNWHGIVPDYFESSYNNAIAWTSACMVPKKILTKLNGFDETITLGAGEDTDLWIRIALKHPVAFNNEVTAIHNLQAENRVSNTKTDLRTFINFDKYNVQAEKHASLKKYLDINRFAVGMQYRINGQEKKALSYFEKIDYSNLNKKQRFLLSKNRDTLLAFKNLQNLFRKWRINLTPFH